LGERNGRFWGVYRKVRGCMDVWPIPSNERVECEKSAGGVRDESNFLPS